MIKLTNKTLEDIGIELSCSEKVKRVINEYYQYDTQTHREINKGNIQFLKEKINFLEKKFA